MSQTNATTIKTYEAHVNEYLQGTPQVVSGELKAWIERNLAKLKQNAKIFEIGSGTGKDADYIESKGFSVQRSDATKAFVKFLKDKGHEAKVFNAISDAFPGSYDMIFADAVLLHFNRDETKQVAAKVFQALNPNGRFVFNLKRGDGDELVSNKLHDPRYFCFWQPDEITKLLTDTGFEDVEVKVIDDYRGKIKPDWLLISAVKGAKT
jgi:SAM-dependent methyltransferase